MHTEFSSVRTAPIAPADTTARIFIDNSVFEIFINDGEMVFLAVSSLVKIKHIFQFYKEIQLGSIIHYYLLQIQKTKEESDRIFFSMLQLIGESI